MDFLELMKSIEKKQIELKTKLAFLPKDEVQEQEQLLDDLIALEVLSARLSPNDVE